MTYLLADTNILLRFISPSDPNHHLVRSAILSLLKNNEIICYTPQNLVELWNVCTRPTTARGGFGLSAEQTDKRAQVIERNLMLLPDNAAIHRQWRQLVVKYRVSGVQVHDTRLVAAMLEHGVTKLLTFNTDDFKRFGEITVVHPSDVLIA
jgi:predicted nucleic acid-binding protein